MNGKLPKFPIWVDDYLGDTTTLSCIEHGAYFLLLINMWRQKGSLPDDRTKLMRLLRCDGRQYQSIRANVIDVYFTSEDGVLTNQRLSRELDNALQYVAKQSAAGSASAKARLSRKAKGDPQGDNGGARTDGRKLNKTESAPMGVSYPDNRSQQDDGKPLENNEPTPTTVVTEDQRASDYHHHHHHQHHRDTSGEVSHQTNQPPATPSARGGSDDVDRGVLGDLDDLGEVGDVEEDDNGLAGQIIAAAAPVKPSNWSETNVMQMVEWARSAANGHFWTDERLIDLATYCRRTLGPEQIMSSPNYLQRSARSFAEASVQAIQNFATDGSTAHAQQQRTDPASRRAASVDEAEAAAIADLVRTGGGRPSGIG